MEENTPPPDLLEALNRMGLFGATTGSRLTGGVSSDIWRIDLACGAICVKRALPRLRVAALWEAPVERNRFEARWIQHAAAASPGSVPELLGQDDASGALAMRYYPPTQYKLWKSELHAGRAIPAFAGKVGSTLAHIHAATASDPTCADDFPTDAIFFDIRLEPYLVATAAQHPDRAAIILDLVETTLGTKRALVHGDVSPKNILIGPMGPIFLDAECAWWGDPAFDLAFCLNHLLLKCLWTPFAQPGFLACFHAFVAGYCAGVSWEPAAAIEARAAHLLPALLLARVDGKSPAEYLTLTDQHCVRSAARAWLASPTDHLAEIADAWRKELSR